MRYAVNVPNFEDYGDARTVAGLAADAEAAGWDGFFVWDHLAFVKAWRLRIADPWVLLTAVALATERLRLGPMVTPLPRRRPWKLARETVTLDRLSGGRLVLGVGLGEPPEDEFGSFGEPADPVVRAAMLDEGLEVLTRLWSGETVSFSGRHYRVLPADPAAAAPHSPLGGRRLAAPWATAAGRPLRRQLPAEGRRRRRAGHPGGRRAARAAGGRRPPPAGPGGAVRRDAGRDDPRGPGGGPGHAGAAGRGRHDLVAGGGRPAPDRSRHVPPPGAPGPARRLSAGGPGKRRGSAPRVP
jgi:alkanesulfonate monooxygenase SsuD/methylene tetrahydromethanopterin reductase-like flavin-dependent oxidoreductase (luciferase family)